MATVKIHSAREIELMIDNKIRKKHSLIEHRMDKIWQRILDLERLIQKWQK